MPVLKVATCQFPVSADIEQNAGWTEQDLYDSTGLWRRRAIAGILHSGELAEDDH